MKKLLTVLLTLVMAISLVVLNNNHTKADEGNDNYTYTFNNGSWDKSPGNPYSVGDKIIIKNETMANTINLFINGSFTGVIMGGSQNSHDITCDGARLTLKLDTGGNAEAFIIDKGDYIYTYTKSGATGAWSDTTQQSYSAGQKIVLISPDSNQAIYVYVNDNLIQMISDTTYDYTIVNNGAKISLTKKSGNEGIGEVRITDTAPTPTPEPAPSEPVVKDESCEKVIGPTWHWNESKGICEDYGVVGTSTRGIDSK